MNAVGGKCDCNAVIQLDNYAYPVVEGRIPMVEDHSVMKDGHCNLSQQLLVI